MSLSNSPDVTETTWNEFAVPGTVEPHHKKGIGLNYTTKGNPQLQQLSNQCVEMFGKKSLSLVWKAKFGSSRVS